MTAEWQPPHPYTLNTENELTELVADTKAARVIDPIDQIADDLYEYEHPDRLDDSIGRQAHRAALLGAGVSYGTWFHYQGSNGAGSIVRYAPRDTHYALRTARNRPLITTDEQMQLRDSTIAVIGLSVGSQAVEPLVRSGIGSRYLLFDSDTVSVANLNRINATYLDAGRLKTDVAGDVISHLDPYVDQHHFPEGYTPENDSQLRALRPDFIVEEVDDMVAKARVRQTAAELGIPLVMAGDVHDRSVISVERHDREAVKPFNGRLSESEFQRLAAGEMSEAEKAKMLAKIIGLSNVSMRLLGAVPEIGKSIAGMPQLGTAAATGGVLDAMVVRDVMLGRGTSSTVEAHDARAAIGSRRSSTVDEGIRSIFRYAKHLRATRTAERGE